MGRVEAEMLAVICRLIDAGADSVTAKDVLAAVVPPGRPQDRMRPAYAYGLDRLCRRRWLNMKVGPQGETRYYPAPRGG